MRRPLALLGSLALCALAQVPGAHAQAPAEGLAHGESVLGRPRPAFESEGLQLDRLLLAPLRAAGLVSRPAGGRSGIEAYPRLEVSAEHDDNVFRASSGTRADTLTRIAPKLRLVGEGDTHVLGLAFDAEIGRWASTSSENYEDWGLRGDWSVDAGDRLKVRAELGRARGHNARGTVNDPGALTPLTVFDRTDGRLDLRLGLDDGPFGQLILEAARLDYEPASGLSTRDFERDTYETALRLGYEIEGATALFLEPALIRNRYRNGPDANGIDRDSSERRLSAGLIYDPDGIAAVTGRLGYYSKDFADARLGSLSGLFADVGGLWNLTPVMTLSGGLSRSNREVVNTTASTATVTGGRLRLDWDPLEEAIVSLDLGLAREEYDAQGREDRVARVGLGLRYLFDEHFYAGLRYAHERRDSDAAGATYRDNRLMFTFGAKMCCAAEPGEGAP